MTKEELKKRTKDFAIRVFKFLKTLPKGKEIDIISYQLFKSSSSVAANYRDRRELNYLMKETNELVSIFSAAIKTIKNNNANNPESKIPNLKSLIPNP